MRTVPAFRPSAFGIAAAVALLCVAAAGVVLAIVSSVRPPVSVSYSFNSLDGAWFHAASGGALIPLALWLRSRREAMAYALLVGACLLAGWAIQVVQYDHEAPVGLVRLVDLLAGLALVPAPTAILAAFASTRRDAWRAARRWCWG